ncbi:hypothetical protein Tco_1035543 [Tanacetum coccineum]
MVVAAPPNAPLSCDKPQTERTIVVRAVVVIGWCRGGCGCGVVVSWVKAAAVDGGDGEDGRLWLPEGRGRRVEARGCGDRIDRRCGGDGVEVAADGDDGRDVGGGGVVAGEGGCGVEGRRRGVAVG